MVIVKDQHRFEITVDQFYDQWLAALREYVPGRLYPTVHVLRTFDTREAAIEGLRRRWRVLFPDQRPLVWRDVHSTRAQRHSSR